MVEHRGLGFAAASLGTPRTRRKGNRGAEWYEDGDKRGRGRKERWVGGDEVRVAGGRRRRCVGRRGDADGSARGHPGPTSPRGCITENQGMECLKNSKIYNLKRREYSLPMRRRGIYGMYVEQLSQSGRATAPLESLRRRRCFTSPSWLGVSGRCMHAYIHCTAHKRGSPELAWNVRIWIKMNLAFCVGLLTIEQRGIGDS